MSFLIAVSIAMSVVVFQWMKTYVPTDSVKCPDGTSFFIKASLMTASEKP